MYCHDKYDCPSLDAACKKYLASLVTRLDSSIVIPILRSVARYGYTEARTACVKWAAQNMDIVMRSAILQ